jgi:hypothetical protein
MAGAEVAPLGAASRWLAERGMNAHAPRFATGLTENSSDDTANFARAQSISPERVRRP